MLNCYTYKLLNKDLTYLNDNELINHYYTHGINENRLCNLSFDYNRYKKDYPDLIHLNNDQLIWHYQHDGRNEGRKAYTINNNILNNSLLNNFKTLCIFTRKDLWETNFLKTLISNNNTSLYYDGVENININYIKSLNFNKIVLIVCSHIQKIDNYEKILYTISKLKPNILINISDEKGDNHNFDNFYNKVPLYLRSYCHYSTNNLYLKLPNINYLPLGYTNDTNINLIENNLKNVYNRNYNWAFVGGTKHGKRENMLLNFKRINNYKLLENVPRGEVGNTYKNCIFVPNANGNCTLTCFRHFESSICGAIPVLANCDKKMLTDLLISMENPPWLIYDNWNHAINECKKLLNNKHELQQIQNRLISWWKYIINKRIDLINRILN